MSMYRDLPALGLVSNYGQLDSKYCSGAFVVAIPSISSTPSITIPPE